MAPWHKTWMRDLGSMVALFEVFDSPNCGSLQDGPAVFVRSLQTGKECSIEDARIMWNDPENLGEHDAFLAEFLPADYVPDPWYVFGPVELWGTAATWEQAARKACEWLDTWE